MKKICIALALSVASTIVPVFNTTNVYAANNTGGNNIETVVKNELDIEDFNYIQNNYLCQAIDGTFYLDNSISNEYSNEQIDSIKMAMSGINNLIEQGVLEFELSQAKNSSLVKVTNTVNKFEEYQKEIQNAYDNSKIGNFGKTLGSYTYCSNYTFSWWGYTTRVNALGSTLLRDELQALASMTGGVTTTIGLATLMIKACGPVWGTIITSAVKVVGTIPYGIAIKNFNYGITSGRGTQVTGVSNPSDGVFFKVETI